MNFGVFKNYHDDEQSVYTLSEHVHIIRYAHLIFN